MGVAPCAHAEDLSEVRNGSIPASGQAATHLGAKVRPEEFVQVVIRIGAKVNFRGVAALVGYKEIGVVVKDPLDLDVRILIDATGLLEEALYSGQPIQPSGVAGDDLACLMTCVHG